MTAAMFHMKHRARTAKRGSSTGLEGSGAAPDRAKRRLKGAGAMILLGTLLAGCSSPEEIADTASIAQSPAVPAVPTPPVPTPGKTDFTDKATKGDARREFAYSWPAEVSAVPQLTERFTAERDALLSEHKTDWEQSLREFAGQKCGGCVNRLFEKTWEVVADLPRFLSLSASFYEYSGGAHGNGAYQALVWDREARAAFDPKAMFRSPEALQAALGDTWCKALKSERMKRLGADYSEDSIFTCPPITDLTVLAGSTDKRAFDRIGLLAAPYVAGSYAEGTYEVTLPVTRAVLDAVKPEYASAFALAK